MPSAKSRRAQLAEVGSSASVTLVASREPVGVATAKQHASRRSVKQLTDLPLLGCPGSAPTRSDGANNRGAEGRSVMRIVALDLGARKIAYCEVANGEVTRRLTVDSVEALEPVLG